MTPHKRRLFIGFALSTEDRQKLREWQATYSALPVRWTPPENFHITLIPPWYEENVASIKSRVHALNANFSGESVEFFQVEYGPKKNNPRLIWAIGKAPASLVKLQKEMQRIFPEARADHSFFLHITLARFHPDDFVGLALQDLPQKISWKISFPELTLFESHLEREGARYEIL